MRTIINYTLGRVAGLAEALYLSAPLMPHNIGRRDVRRTHSYGSPRPMNRRGARSLSYSQARPLPERIKNLLRYYIECVRQDEGQSIRAFLDDAGKRFVPWPFPSDLWCLDDAEPRITLDPDQSRFADELRRRSGGGALLYGYPTYIGRQNEVIPLFTWPIEYELNGRELWLHASPEWPQMNPTYLRRLASTEEEQREILDALGLLDTTEDPSEDFIRGILKRMEDKGLLQDVREPLDP